jgi:tetratricopeptide (TPR) repeat protein
MTSRPAWLSALLALSACASTWPVDAPAEQVEIAPVAGASSSTAPPPGKTGAVAALDTRLFEEVRDERVARRHPRTSEAVTAEIQALEQRFSTTAKTDPERPQVIRQLAESYVELAIAAVDRPGTVSAARKKAITDYRLLADAYPNATGRDEALYYLALEHERAADLSSARKTYLELITKAPTSSFVPNAYVAFGELFFAEAETDPSKWTLAAQSFKEATKYPPPNNRVYAYAWYRNAIVLRQTGEVEQASNAFARALAATESHPNLPAAGSIGEAARRAMNELPRGR